MVAVPRIENALEKAIERAVAPPAPPSLAAAIRHAVFPGGARVRPRLCLSVARACGDGAPEVADAAAAAIELLHCASLVHDDLPCFDNAPIRRGRPSVHAAFGQPLAVLAGDGLIVLGFETVAAAAPAAPSRACAVLTTLAGAAGSPTGLVAGQAWECESAVSLADYHRAKTGSLFAAATMAGALAAGADPGPWRALGEKIGEAYQVADDLHDLASNVEELGKPCGRDKALGRPCAPEEYGVAGAITRLESLLAEAVAAIPECPGADDLRAIIVAEAKRFVPKEMARRAA